MRMENIRKNYAIHKKYKMNMKNNLPSHFLIFWVDFFKEKNKDS